ncbi:unnamed protein product [Alternaria alternata]
MLGLEPVIKAEETNIDRDSDEEDLDEDEKIRTVPDGWRSWTSCRAEWEELGTPPPEFAFLANQKPLDVPPILQGDTSDTTESTSDSDTNAPTRRPKPQIDWNQEVQPVPIASSSDEGSDIEMEQPIQSIETRNDPLHAVLSYDEPKEMDWGSFID